MTKIEMLEKVKNQKGIGVEVVTSSGNEIFYFYEDFENSKGICRAMKLVYPMMDTGRFKKVTFIA